MIVTLDGQRVRRNFAPGTSLQGILDLVRKDFRDDRLITSVAVNGQPCGEHDLPARLAEPVGEADQVDLESADPRVVSAEAFRGAAQDLAETGRRQVEIADQLNSGRTAEALARIGTLVQTWQTCRALIVQCSGLLGEDLTARQVDGRSLAEHLSALVEQLRELRNALDARDMVLLADLLYYEMPATCDTWHDLLLKLADAVSAGTTPA